jgi:hypothetical protein
LHGDEQHDLLDDIDLLRFVPLLRRQHVLGNALLPVFAGDVRQPLHDDG